MSRNPLWDSIDATHHAFKMGYDQGKAAAEDEAKKKAESVSAVDELEKCLMGIKEQLLTFGSDPYPPA